MPLAADFVTGTYIGGFYRCYDNTIHTLPIGTLRAEVRLKNGPVSSFEKIIPAPGSTGADGYSSIYTEDRTLPPNNSISMIFRPGVTSYSIDYGMENLSITFTTNDARVYNGWVWFFDSSSNWVGTSSTYFRNSENGTVNPILNAGGAFYIDGTENVISISASDLVFDTDKAFSDIEQFMVVVTDGAQYVPELRYTAYDCRAASEKTGF